MNILYFSVISGFLSFGSQFLWYKIASTILGDSQFVYFGIVCVFVFSAILGYLISEKYKNSIRLIEGFTGLFALLTGCVLFFYSSVLYGLPDSVVWILMLIPAIGSGLVLPIYMRWSGENAVRTYYRYHFAGFISILLLEVASQMNVRTSVLLLSCALLQIMLAWKLKSVYPPRWSDLRKLKVFSKLGLFAFLSGWTSFFIATMLVRTIFWLEMPLKIWFSAFMAGPILAITLGGLLSRWRYGYIPVVLLPIITSIFQFPVAISIQSTGSWIFFGVAGWLWIVITFATAQAGSSYIFSKYYSEYLPGNTLALFSFGNISGVLSAILIYPLISFLPWLYVVPLLWFVLLYAIVYFKYGNVHCKQHYFILYIFILLLWCTSIASINYQKRLEDVVFFSGRCSTNFHSRLKKNCYNPPVWWAHDTSGTVAIAQVESSQKYYIAGYYSHLINWFYMERNIGLMSAGFSHKKFKHTLVIGIGSGQEIDGAGMISERVTAVDLASVAEKSARLLAIANNDIFNDKKITWLTDDGILLVKNCVPGTYDQIIQTSTLPITGNSYKLYSLEFMSFASRCLGESGIYHTYFDGSYLKSDEDIAIFLEPIRRSFKYVKILKYPYPQVFASNSILGEYSSPVKVIDASDYVILKKNTPIEILEKLYSKENEFVLPYDFPRSELINTLDNSLLSNMAWRNYIATRKNPLISSSTLIKNTDNSYILPFLELIPIFELNQREVK